MNDDSETVNPIWFKALGQPFLIAEIGVNYKLSDQDRSRLGYRDDMEVAIDMIDKAAAAGVDAVKFQLFSAADLHVKGVPKPAYQKTSGIDGSIDYLELIHSLESTEEEHRHLQKAAAEKGVTFISTPYDTHSLIFLAVHLDLPAIKLASIELNNHLLLCDAIRTQKPIILSSGLSTAENVRRTISLFRSFGASERLCLMQCTSDYPTAKDETNVAVIKEYLRAYPEVTIGFSDHSASELATPVAIGAGARVIERHFTLDTRLDGPDHAASMDLDGLSQWVAAAKDASTLLGCSEKNLTAGERNNISMRKNLVSRRLIARGERISKGDLTAKRSGGGILPTTENVDLLMTMQANVEILEDTPLKWSLFSKSS